MRRYYFATPALQLRLDLVREYIQNTESPVLVCGDTGAGKSLFLDRIVWRADCCWRLVRVPAVETFSPVEVVKFINVELRLPINASSDAMIGKLNRFLKKIAMRGRLAVIMVDDVHELADAALVRLVTLCEELEWANCRLLMTGLPATRSRLTGLLSGVPTQVRPHVVTIPTLNAREVASYIDMKLYYAGVDSRRPFSRTVIDDIAHSSQGHPGRIDVITETLLAADRKSLESQGPAGSIRRLVNQLSGLGAMR